MEEPSAYRDLRQFDRRPAADRLRMIWAGTLVWYADAFRCPETAYPRLRKIPFFYEAEKTYYRTSTGRITTSRAFERHIRTLLKKGAVGPAIEYYFAFRRPDLTLITTRPLYHFLGGNRRPFAATLVSFFYTAFIVHPLLPLAVLLGALGYSLAPAGDPSEQWRNVIRFSFLPLLGGVIWTLLGTLTAMTKSLRR